MPTAPVSVSRSGPLPTVDAAAVAPRPEPLRTEFAFELPRGYVDGAGNVHRSGVMRLATARDELVPLRDDRVRENPAYLSVVLLARVVTRLGTIDDIHAGIIENLFATDLAFLQDLYRRVNQEGHTRAGGHLPGVRAHVRRRRRREPPGGIVTYAPDQAARGGRVHRLPLPLGAGPDARPRARGPAPLRRRDQQDERPGTAGEVTGMGLWSWLRGSWSDGAAAVPAGAGRAPLPAAAPDPGWRALPPVQRALARRCAARRAAR